MRRFTLLCVGLMLLLAVSATVHAGGKRVVAVMHGTDLGQGEGGGGPLYEDGSARGNFAISVVNGRLIFTVALDSWYYYDAEHIVACGTFTVVRNELGIPLPAYGCTTPVPISGFPVYTDYDGDGRADFKEWVRLIGR